MNSPKCNIVVVGVSCFDGMANSMRVRNLFEPLVNKDLISLHNLIYQKNNKEPIGKKGEINNISFKVIGFRLSNIFTLFSFFFGGIFFLNKSKLPKYKNLLYVFDYPDIKNIWFILYAKLIGYKIILDIVEDNRFEAHVGVINKFRIKTSLVLIKTCKYIADSMIGISGHLYKRLLSVSRGKVPVFLIPITVNLNYFKNTIYSTDKKNIKIFYGGSYGQKDGLEYLISAFDEVNKKTINVELILTGIGHKLDMDRINLQRAWRWARPPLPSCCWRRASPSACRLPSWASWPAWPPTLHWAWWMRACWCWRATRSSSARWVAVAAICSARWASVGGPPAASACMSLCRSACPR